MTKDDLEFPINRYKHCFNVGLKMYWYAKLRWGWSEDRCINMFALGNLHDIGYIFDGDPNGQHGEIIGGAMVSTYEHSHCIYNHSNMIDDPSDELKLLYYADGSVDGYGNWCTFEERSKDAFKRREFTVEEKQKHLAAMNKLREWGFDDTFSKGEVICKIK